MKLLNVAALLVLTLPSMVAYSHNVELPTPTGPHAVGRTSLHWVDATREEAMTDDPTDRRAVMVTLWYPAAAGTGTPAPYLDHLDELASALGQVNANLARRVQSHSLSDVPPEPTDQQLAERKVTRAQVAQMREQEREREAAALRTIKAGSYRLSLRGATHQSFSDEPLLLPFGDAETKAGHLRRTQLIRAYTLALFEQCLKKQKSDLHLARQPIN